MMAFIVGKGTSHTEMKIQHWRAFRGINALRSAPALDIR